LLLLANEEKNYVATPMLNWFVEEQVEEESTAFKIVHDLERVGNDGGATYDRP